VSHYTEVKSMNIHVKMASVCDALCILTVLLIPIKMDKLQEQSDLVEMSNPFGALCYLNASMCMIARSLSPTCFLAVNIYIYMSCLHSLCNCLLYSAVPFLGPVRTVFMESLYPGQFVVYL
jgi:hypothetical protein